jgi:hypothetical protein
MVCSKTVGSKERRVREMTVSDSNTKQKLYVNWLLHKGFLCKTQIVRHILCTAELSLEQLL